MWCLRRASPSWLTLLLLLLIVIVIMFWYQCHPPESTATATPSPSSGPPRVHVLLLSSWRSGSSLLGQAFSQHPSVFYLMEPAWNVWTTLGMPGAQGLRMAVRDLLHQVLQCDLSVMEPYGSVPFMWSQSRALCSPPACSLTPRGAFSNESECYKHCKFRGLATAEDTCRNYTHVVLKEVRVFELESLYPLLRDPSIDLRIVHLVRDPRAVFRSRENSFGLLARDSELVLGRNDIKRPEIQYRTMQEVCRSHVRIHDTAMLKPPDFLQGRYKMVRYEDMVSDPLAQVRDIYRFTGLEMTAELEDWLYRITHGKGTKKAAFKVTSRNATVVSRAWRTTLSYQKVQRIQRDCKSAMSLLGYRTVDSEKEHQDLDIDVVLPRKPLKFTWLSSR